MPDIPADRATKIKDEAALDAKNVTEKYNKAEKDGAGVATTALQNEVNDFHKRAGQTPEERKLYIKTLTEALEAGEDGKGKNALLPKISEAWLLNPDNKVMRDHSMTADRMNDRILANERFAQYSPENSDLLMLDTAMSESIKKVYFTNNRTRVSDQSVKNDLDKSEKTRGADIWKAKYAVENNDIAKVILDNPKLFNALDSAKNGSRDGYISYTDVSKFLTEYNDKSNPNTFQNFTPEEAAAVQKLKDRWDNIDTKDAYNNNNGLKDILYSGTLQYFLTKDSLQKGITSAKPGDQSNDKPTVQPNDKPAAPLTAQYDSGLTRTYKYDGGKLSEISDGQHTYTVKATATGNELWEGNTKTKYTDAAVAPNGDFSYKDEGAPQTDAAKTTSNPEPPKTPAPVDKSDYDSGLTRTYKYDGGKLSEISDGQHTYTVKATATGNELWEGNTKTKYTDAAVAPNGDFSYKDDGAPQTDAAKTTPKTDDANVNLSYDSQNKSQLNSVRYPGGIKLDFEYDKGNTDKITKFTRTDASGKHECTVKENGDVYEGERKLAISNPKVDQKTGEFTYTTKNEQQQQVQQQLKVAPQFKDLSDTQQKELQKKVSDSLKVGEGQGYWQVAEQVLKVNGNKHPAASDIKELMVILQKANIDKATKKPKQVLTSKDVLLATETQEFKDLLNRMAS